MKIKIKPIRNTLGGELVGFIEVFDPRVIYARPAIPAIAADPENNVMAQPGVAGYPGTLTLIARFYDQNGNTVGTPIRNELTELTAEQYLAWSQFPSPIDDDAKFFAECVMANLGLQRAVE